MNYLWWKFNLSAHYSFRTLFACSKWYVKTIKKHFKQDLLPLQWTSKLFLSIIENNRYLTDVRCFWGLNIFSTQNRLTICRSVPPCRQLILYCFLGFLVFIIINSSAVKKQKQMKTISLNYFTGHIKKVIYVFHSNWNSCFHRLFILICFSLQNIY